MKAQDLKNSILQLAVQGKLVPQDPADEPTSVLLAKIRAEKEKLIKTGKLKKEKNPSEIIIASDGIPYEKFSDGKITDISGEIPFAIPPTWQWVKLIQVSKNIHYGFTASAEILGNTKLLRITDIQENSVDWGTVPFCSTSIKEYETYGLNNRDIMVARTGGTIGKTYIVRNLCEKVVFASYLIRVIPVDLIDEEFLKVFMESPLYWTQLSEKSMGTGQPNVNGENLKSLFLPLPPLVEQKRIVAKIEELLPHIERYGKAEAELDDLQKRFPEELKKSILQSAIQGKLVPQYPTDEPAEVLLERIRAEKLRLIKSGKIKPSKNESTIFRASDRLHYEKCGTEPRCIEAELPFPIPDSWQWVRLDTICIYIQRGKSPKYSLIKKYPVVAQKCNQWSGFSLDKAQFIEPNSLSAYSEERLLQDGDLLWNSTGLGTLGRMAIYAHAKNPYGIAVADSHVTVIRAMKNFIISNYLYDYFTAPIVQSVIEEQSDGSTKQKELATTTVKNYLVPLPPLAEQMRIVTKIEELLKNIEPIKP